MWTHGSGAKGHSRWNPTLLAVENSAEEPSRCISACCALPSEEPWVTISSLLYITFHIQIFVPWFLALHTIFILLQLSIWWSWDVYPCRLFHQHLSLTPVHLLLFSSNLHLSKHIGSCPNPATYRWWHSKMGILGDSVTNQSWKPTLIPQQQHRSVYYSETECVEVKGQWWVVWAAEKTDWRGSTLSHLPWSCLPQSHLQFISNWALPWH